MSFMIQGTPTPRNIQHPGSARSRQQYGRPDSAKPKFDRNPITGVETPTQRPDSKLFSRRPEGVPELDLDCFKVEPKTVLPEVYDYPLDSGRSGSSTVSWGTDTGRSYRASARSARAPSARQIDSPYHLQLQEEPPKPAHKPREPTAWDRQPISEDLPEPGDKHKQLYQQYKDEMKESYKKQSKQLHVDDIKLKHLEDQEPKQDDVNEEIHHMKKKTYGEIRKEVEDEDFLDLSWSKRKPGSKTEMLKKMDAEDMLEYNKKQKMIETVMIDQLSRAVISDPDQNRRVTVPVSERPHRGSQRMLHESKVRTKNTTTENLLSKRVRFGARVLTRNGHDAMRELTGFFFHFDNTLTIYEFRQFGKSAKALPFIVRGRYVQLQGPREDESYNLMDIYSGNELMIESRGQHSLPDTLKKQKTVYFRITDVDEDERQNLLREDFGYTNRSEVYARMNAQNKEEYLNKKILEGVQDAVSERLKKRGIKTVTGLGRYYRKLDKSGCGVLYRFELEKGLFTYHIELPPQGTPLSFFSSASYLKNRLSRAKNGLEEIFAQGRESLVIKDLDSIFDVLDPAETGELDYSIYMRGIIGQMDESRKNLVRKAFRKIDSQKRGVITINEIKKYFNASFQPPYRHGATPGVSSLQAFLDGIQSCPDQEEISYVEFEEYYEGLSISIDSNLEFANILHNTWNI